MSIALLSKNMKTHFSKGKKNGKTCSTCLLWHCNLQGIMQIISQSVSTLDCDFFFLKKKFLLQLIFEKSMHFTVNLGLLKKKSFSRWDSRVVNSFYEHDFAQIQSKSEVIVEMIGQVSSFDLSMIISSSTSLWWLISHLLGTSKCMVIRWHVCHYCSVIRHSRCC